MAEKIKRTHAERDALLSKVFDSTLQTKDIEITEAGTMEITPDEGFFALKKVNLNVNVQGGGGGSNGEMRYYQINMKENTDVFVHFYGTNMKADMGEGELQIVGVGLIFAYNIPKTNWKAVAINVDMPTYSPTEGGIISFREQLESQGRSIDDLADVGLINITKEEFYAL